MGPSPTRSRLATAYRRGGPRQVLWGLLAVTVFRRLDVYESRLALPQTGRKADLPIEPAELRPQELDAYRRLRPDTSVRELRRRLARGDRCFVAWSEGELISARWLSFGQAEVRYLGLRFKLPADVAYPHDAYTPPRLRSRGVSTAMGTYMAETVREEGMRAMVSLILPENRGGVGLMIARGTIPRGTVACVRIGPWRIPVRRDQPGLLGAATPLRKPAASVPSPAA